MANRIAEYTSVSIIDDQEYKFPLLRLQKGTEGVLEELQIPIQIKIEEIILDMQKFVNSFPRDTIPHTAGGTVVDKVHNFNRLEKVKWSY
jgi:hypothetical protein